MALIRQCTSEPVLTSSAASQIHSSLGRGRTRRGMHANAGLEETGGSTRSSRQPDNTLAAGATDFLGQHPKAPECATPWRWWPLAGVDRGCPADTAQPIPQRFHTRPGSIQRDKPYRHT